MADYYLSSMSIGGRITQSDLDKLNELIASESPDDFDSDGFISFTVWEQRYGVFEEIEEFCKQKNLTFTHFIESKYGNDSVLEWWSPDGRDGWCLSSVNEEPCIRVSDVIQAIDDGTMQKLIKENSPPDIPAIEVIEGTETLSPTV